MCVCATVACVPTELESTCNLVSSVVSYGTITSSLQSLSFSSWNAHACSGPQKNFVFFLVRMRRGSVTSGYDAWPTLPPSNFALNCTVCKKTFHLIGGLWLGHSLITLHFTRNFVPCGKLANNKFLFTTLFVRFWRPARIFVSAS